MSKITYAVTLTEYSAFGYSLYDADVSYHCHCCGSAAIRHYANITIPRAQYLAAHADKRTVHRIQVKYLDAYLRLRDDPHGCYSPQGYWVDAPFHRLELEDRMTGAKKTKERKENRTLKLAEWFVTEYLKRPWSTADFRGSHMAHAKNVLRDYDAVDIQGCLVAANLGLLGDLGNIALATLTIIRKFEPPLIDRWFEYKRIPPAPWKTAELQKWSALTGHAIPYAEVSEESNSHMPLRAPDLRPETRSAASE